MDGFDWGHTSRSLRLSRKWRFPESRRRVPSLKKLAGDPECWESRDCIGMGHFRESLDDFVDFWDDF